MNAAISIGVIILNQSLQLYFLWEDTEGSESLFKFLGVQLVVSIEVHLVEDSSKGSNTYSTLLLD